MPPADAAAPDLSESESDFEKRATQNRMPLNATPEEPAAGADDLERASTREAIALYQKLLAQFPHYERNDQVLYQMSRAYEELGQTQEAMTVMDRMVRNSPARAIWMRFSSVGRNTFLPANATWMPRRLTRTS